MASINASPDVIALNPHVFGNRDKVIPSKNKYYAEKTTVDGIKFDSKREAQRYIFLKAREQNGRITNLQLQPKFELQPKFKDKTGKTHRAIHYIADFQYVEDGKTIIEDAKGVKTAVFRLKMKLFLFTYPHLELRLT